MPITRSMRAVLALAIVALAGCVAPPTVAPGQNYASNQCFAGFYVCTVATSGAPGTPCACPGLGAPSYGIIR